LRGPLVRADNQDPAFQGLQVDQSQEDEMRDRNREQAADQRARHNRTPDEKLRKNVEDPGKRDKAEGEADAEPDQDAGKARVWIAVIKPQGKICGGQDGRKRDGLEYVRGKRIVIECEFDPADGNAQVKRNDQQQEIDSRQNQKWLRGLLFEELEHT
jgi:hypothetical protein